MEKKRILVYIGLNQGNGFDRLLNENNYDYCFGFEPIPELAEFVKNKHKHNPKVEIIQAAITEEDGDYDFFITQNNGRTNIKDSSSLFEITDFYRETTGNNIHTNNKITVRGINISNFLKSRGIDYITDYVSDAEGNDFTILKTLKNLIDDRRIEKIQVESEVDYINEMQRNNQPTNKESDFLNFLSENYEIYKKQEGNYDPKSQKKWCNRDLFFKLK